jgi:hypothetical protein
MTFLNPLVLLGLAAAAIPILLHLLNLRKLKTVDFSTLRFLKELQKTTIRRLKTQQILLLILRTLIVIFSVLAFSRPALRSSLPAIGTHARTSVIVVLDNSVSMDISDTGGNRFRQARDMIMRIAGALKEGDEMALLPLSSIKSDKKRSFTQNFAFLKEEIQKLSISTATADINEGLRAASALLNASQNINREIYIITDAQNQVAQSIARDSSRLFSDNTSIFVVPAGRQDAVSDQNISLDSLAIITRIFEREKPVEVQAIVHNSSNRDAAGIVLSMLFNGERMAQRTVDIPAGQTRTVAISAIPRGNGLIKAAVEIENDALEADNKRYFGFMLAPPPSVGIIGNTESTEFLKLGLGPDISALRSYAPGQSAALRFDENDVMIIASMLPESDALRLDQYINGGGNVLIFADAEAAEQQQIQFLNSVGIAPVNAISFTAQNPGGFIMTDRRHPLFNGVFKGQENTLPGESPRMLKAMPCGAGQEIISMQGGAFLSEIRRGEGRILYCAVPAGTAWSNLPYTGIMPTIIHRALRYLSTRQELAREIQCGQEARMILPARIMAGTTLFKIQDPAGLETMGQTVSLPAGISISAGNPVLPGVYAISTQNGMPISSLSVNLQPREGHLYYTPYKELLNVLKKRLSAPDNAILLESDPADIAQNVAKARIGTELWRFFLGLAIACAIAEMFIAMRAGNKAVSAG